MAISLIIALLVGGGASFAAENALPGDALYPVKVEVNERVRGWAAVSAEAETEWETRVVERRLEEAARLAAENRMTADVRSRIEANFEKHAERVQKQIAALETKASNAAVDISAQFETSLTAHAAILEQVPDEEAERVGIEPLIIRVRAHAAQAAEARQLAEARIATSTDAHVQAVAEGRHAAAERKIAETRASLQRASVAEIEADVEARLEHADQLVGEGEAKMEAQAYNEAFILFQNAYRIAQETQLFVSAQQSFNSSIQITLPSSSLDIQISAGTQAESGTSTETNTEIETGSSTEVEVELEGSTSTQTGSGTVESETEAKGTIEVDIGL